MKEYEFPYYVSFGKNDSVDCIVDCTLDDEQAERLEASARVEPRWRLSEDDSISDIYDVVYEEILELEKSNLMDDTSVVEDYLSWEPDYDPAKPITEEDIDKYIDSLNIGINYPEELQDIEEK